MLGIFLISTQQFKTNTIFNLFGLIFTPLFSGKGVFLQQN